MSTDVLRDERKPGWYIIDNEIIDVYGARMGPYGIAVYNVIARHAGKSGGSFPSYKTISEKVGIGRSKAVQTVTLLIELGLLTKTQRTDAAGDATSNQYTLVDIKALQGGGVVSVENHLVSTENHRSIPQIPGVVSDVDTKKTISKENKVKESTAIVEPLPEPAAQPSLQQPSFNTGSKYQNKQHNQITEYIKSAKALGLTPETFRLIVDTVLEGLGTKNRANAGNDEVLKTAQNAANELIHYESGRFRTVESVKAVFESWTANDYRGDTLPTCEQFLHHAGLVDMNKVVRTRKTPTTLELSQPQPPVKKVLAFKEFCLKEFTTDIVKHIPGGEAAARERYARYQQQQQTH